MAGIGTKPSMLAPIIPEAPPLANVTNVQFPQSAAPMEQQAPTEESFDDVLAEMEQQPAQEEENFDDVLLEQQQDDEPVTSDKGPDFMTRLVGSFPRGDKETKGFLEERLGKKNVRYRDGEFQVKVENKWTPYDPEGFEAGDIADFGRDVFEEAIATPLTLMSSTNPVTAVAGRAIGSGAGTAAADLVSEKLLGIKQDPDRNKTREALTAATFGAAFGRLDQWLNARKVAKALDKDAVQNVASFAQKRLEDSKGAIARLAELTDSAGNPLIESIPGAKGAYATLLQLDPSSPEAREILQRISSDKRVREALDFIGQNAVDATTKFAGDLGNLEAKVAGKGKAFTDQVSEVYRSAGKIIGDHRKRFIKEAGDGVIPVTRLEETLGEIAENMGIERRGDKLFIPSVEDLVDNGFAGDEGTAKVLRKNLNALFEKVHNGGGTLSAKELDSQYKIFRRFSDTAAKSSRFADEEKQMYWGLRRALGDDFTKGIGTVLDGNSAYKDAMKDYRAMSVAYDDLGSYISNNGLTIGEIAKNLFGKGNAPGQIEGVKIFLKDKPALWQDVKGAFLKQLMDESPVTNRAGKQVLDGNAFLLKLKKLSPEAKEALFDGAKNGEKVFEDLIQFTGSVKASQIENASSSQKTGILRRLIGIASGSDFVKASKGYDSLAQAFFDLDNKKLVDLVLSPESERLLKGLPSVEVRAAKKFMAAVRKSSATAAKSRVVQSQVKQRTLDAQGNTTEEDVPE